MKMDVSPLPRLGMLRVATPPDVLRIGIVATAGFRHTEQFIWERPRHQQYPQDTILFFREEFADFMKSPEHIVLVAFDKYEADESNKTAAVIPPDNGFTPPEAGEQVIVAVGCWKLEPGSKRKGRFQNKTGEYSLPSGKGWKFPQPHLISQRYLLTLRQAPIQFFQKIRIVIGIRITLSASP